MGEVPLSGRDHRRADQHRAQWLLSEDLPTGYMVTWSYGCDRLTLGGVPREQKMLKGHISRAIYHQVY